jgi:uncharacterized phage protein gp47/JayE
MFRTREDIVAEMLAAWQAAIPDVYTGIDGIIRIMSEIEAGQLENAFLANQLLLEDMFITTASLQGLKMHGEQLGIPLDEGSRAEGTVVFTGQDGTAIPVEAEVGYNPGVGLDVISFRTLEAQSIPTIGIPVASTAIVDVQAGNLNGLYEYVVTYVSNSGETLPSAVSAAVNPVNQRVDLSNIPVGGADTIARRIYRRKGGAGNDFRLVGTLNDNTTTVFEDNITDAAAASGALAPTENTANQVEVACQAVDIGSEGNVIAGAIRELVNVPATILSVVNPAAFTGGDDMEDTEDYRQRLLNSIANPQSGSAEDLEAIAENHPDVEEATVFPNMNIDTPQNGHVTVRIVGPGGQVPSAETVAEVQTSLDALGLANIIIHVTTFTPLVTNVTVDVTLESGFTMGEITPIVQQAVSSYINSIEVGGTMFVAGITDAVFGLSGVQDVVVTVPTTNQTTPATSKRTPGTITVT